ncbi:MAG: rhamnulokinase [bacterium]|nr:rhamnulokinase [bacterium]
MIHVVAFDLGASSGRAILGTFDGSRLTLRELHRFPNQMAKVRGHHYWDSLRLFAEMENGLKIALQEVPIASIGIDTWGVDGTFVGPNDSIVGMPFAYRDFSTENMESCIRLFGREWLYATTGIQFWPFNTLFQFYWHVTQKSPALALAEQFLFSPDYYRYLFTGVRATEYTIASTSQLLDARSRSWCNEIFDKLGVPLRLMGSLIEPGTPCGTVENTNIAAIAVAGHDTASAVVAVPAQRDRSDWAWMSSGTWTIIGIETHSPITTMDACNKGFSNEGGLHGTVRFLKNIMGLWLTQECVRLWRLQGQEFSFPQINELARQAPSTALINVNDMRFYNPPNMIEEIQNACRETGQRVPQTPGEIQRCILESLAHAYAVALNDLASLTGRRFSTLHIVGGGCQNELLNQMTADACGVTVVAGPVEATATGNILVQLVANRALASLDEARAVLRTSFPVKVYQPQR